MRALAFSGGKDSMACLHLLRDTLDCAIYVDTGKSYPETRKMVEYAAKLLPMHVVQTDQQEQNEREGLPADVVPVNWTRFGQMLAGPKPVMVQPYVDCCFENIGLPLVQKAQELKVNEIVYGQRNDDTIKAACRNGDVVGGIVRLHPIEDWTRQQVLDYLATRMTVPEHFYLGHSSLDCYDCTAYSGQTKDLHDYTRRKYPKFYVAYAQRKNALDRVLIEALNGELT